MKPTNGQQILWALPVPPDRNGQQTSRVNILGNERDFHAVVLAHLGRSNKSIFRVTGLSPGQIHYRLKLANATDVRRQWREGEGTLAPLVFGAVVKQAARVTIKEVRLLQNAA